MSVEYERENERIIVAKRDDEEVARIVEVPGGSTSFRMKTDRRRGGTVADVEEAKQKIESYLD